MKKILLSAILFATLTPGASQSYPGPDLSAYNSVMTSPPRNVPSAKTPDGAVAGNGDIGITLGGEPRNLTFHIGKNDFWYAYPSYPQGGIASPGGVTISIEALGDASWRVEQRIDRADILGTFATPDVKVDVRAWVPATRNEVVIEIEADKPCRAKVDLWTTKGNPSIDAQGWQDGVRWVSRSFESVAHIEWECHVAMAMKLPSAGVEEIELKPGHKTTLCVAVYTNFDRPDWKQGAIDAAAASTPASIAQAQKEHDEWWNGFRAESWLDAGDEMLNRYYHTSQYIFACTSREGKFAPGIWGCFVTRDQSAWGGDYHLNYNYQSPYWHLYSSNHIPLADNFEEPLLAFMETGRRMAKGLLGCHGIYFPVGLGPRGFSPARWPIDGEDMQRSYRSDFNGLDGGYKILGQKINAVFSVANMMMRFYSTWDGEYARRIWPYMVGCADFWEDYLFLENGRYVIRDDHFNEVYPNMRNDGYFRRQTGDVNSTLSLGFVEMLFRDMIVLSDFLNLDRERQAKWKDILARLSPYPIGTAPDGERALMTVESGPAPRYGLERVSIHGLVMPTGVCGPLLKPELNAILLNDISRWDEQKNAPGDWARTLGNGSETCYPGAVRVGYDPAKILNELKERIEVGSYPNGWIVASGGGVETLAAVPLTLNEMMLQSYEGVVRFFPNWTRDRDASFHKLRAYGAFLVSGAIKDGKVTGATVVSEKGRPLRLENPWPGHAVEISSDTKLREIYTGRYIDIQTTEGETITLRQTHSIVASGNSPNVASIDGDTLRLVAGTTRRFTVDTPVDEGTVSTGVTIDNIGEQLGMPDGTAVAFTIIDRYRQPKIRGALSTGDVLTLGGGGSYRVVVSEGALSPTLTASRNRMTAGVAGDVTLDFVAGQRSGRATVRIDIPAGIDVTLDNTTVDVIGRGEVSLRDLPGQSIGRHGTNYSYDRVGEAAITAAPGGGQTLTLTGLDLRPDNGVDVRLKIKGVTLAPGGYIFTASYSTSEPGVYHSVVTDMSTARFEVVTAVTDLGREMPGPTISESSASRSAVPVLRWTAPAGAKRVRLEYSGDMGDSWSVFRDVGPRATRCALDGLPSGRYLFRLWIEGGSRAGESNRIVVWAGMQNVSLFGAVGDGTTDDTNAINRAIEDLHDAGGGILTFGKGRWMVRTVHLRSGVWLHVGPEAVIEALPGGDAPEATWFSDRAYRSGLSPVDPAPYAEPENWLTKQDVGHTFFRNTMFFAERQENIRIFGNGRITGGGVLVTGDGVMRNAPDRRADKMFTFKLCRDIEICGYDRGQDMWYDPESDRPYYITGDGGRDYALENVMRIDRGGHFVLLATGTNGIRVHDTCFGTDDSGSARDIYDFMACSDITVTNIYSKVSSDDIVKLGSDCSLGFTRPVSGYMVRNVIGDTNCNLFQIGSETADDISDVWVDNIYVLGSNKAGFSISTNDGARVSNIFLNTGRTGPLHSRSRMHRTRAPFFISISNRGRTLGADVKRFRFREGDRTRDELLVTNSPIGSIDNIVLRDVDIQDVYAGSSFRGERWRAFDGSQNRATPIIAGYALPAPERVEGGLGFMLPDGRHTGYITGIEFSGINLVMEGGNGAEDASASPPEIGVGRYNVGDLAVQPAYGFWFRHARDVVVRDCTIACTEPDGRHAIVLDDVAGAVIERVSMPDTGARPLILGIASRDVVTDRRK